MPEQVCGAIYDQAGNIVGGDPTEPSSAVKPTCSTINTNPDQSIECLSVPAETCKDFQLTKAKDTCFIENVINEHLNIGAADIHVFKLLGVHEQGQLIDLTENGNPISSGDATSFPASNAFTTFITEWRSIQKGQSVISTSFIGYDFGEIKVINGRVRYGIDTNVNHMVSSIKIKQGNNPENRATKARLERSEDGIKWFGAAIVNLPDDNCFNTLNFRASAHTRYWRLRPLNFNGGVNDHWSIQAFEMYDNELTGIKNIQDKFWMENRDRDYASESITIKGFYDLIDVSTELTRFGIELPSEQMYLRIAFNSSVNALGRPIVIGDIFEIPSETQFNAKLEPIKKYMEVTDVSWSSEGYTPGWKPTIQKIVAQPMLATQETADIFGGLEENTDPNGLIKYGLLDIEGIKGEHPILQDKLEIPDDLKGQADTNLPERGRDIADIQTFDDNQVQSAKDQLGINLGNINTNQKQLYVEDGLPPNHLPFTEGDDFPINPNNGDYHRLTYSTIQTNIPPKLFRWSSLKNRWIFQESDKRQLFNGQKPILEEFLSSPYKIESSKIGK